MRAGIKRVLGGVRYRRPLSVLALAALDAAAAAVGARLAARPDDTATLGDPFPQGLHYTQVSSAQVEDAFGGPLLQRLAACTPNTW